MPRYVIDSDGLMGCCLEPSRAQNELLVKLRKFADHRNVSQEQRNYLNGGVCFGLSLKYGLARIQGEEAVRDWCEALDLIVKWNGRNSSLVEEVLFLGETVSRETALQKILEQIINAQIGGYLPGEHNHGDSLSCLQAGAGVEFLIDDRIDHMVWGTIKNSSVISGYFIPGDRWLPLVLENLAHQWNAESKILCIVCSERHACNLYYDARLDKPWFFFDPNNHLRVTGCSVEEVSIQMIENLGCSLRLFVATFDAGQSLSFPAYARMIEEQPELLVRGASLVLVALHCPNVLRRLTELARDREELCEQMVANLEKCDVSGNFAWNGIIYLSSVVAASLLQLAEYNAYFAASLVRALTHDSLSGRNVFALMIKHVPTEISHLFKLTRVNGNIRIVVVRALGMEHESGVTNLGFLIHSLPMILDELCDLVKDIPEIRWSFAALLNTRSSLGGTVIQQIAEIAPHLVIRLLRDNIDDAQFIHGLMGALCTVNDERQLGLETLCVRDQAVFAAFFDFIKERREYLAYFIDMLNWKNAEGKFLLNIILEQTPQVFFTLCQMARNDFMVRHVLDRALFSTNTKIFNTLSPAVRHEAMSIWMPDDRYGEKENLTIEGTIFDAHKRALVAGDIDDVQYHRVVDVMSSSSYITASLSGGNLRAEDAKETMAGLPFRDEDPEVLATAYGCASGL